MQEMFEEFAQRVIVEDPKVMRILQDLSNRKKEKLVKKLSKSDATTILDIIDSESPFSQDL